MEKIRIPRHIDFKPRKDIAPLFERNLDGKKVMGLQGDSSVCPKCKGDKFKGVLYCFKCLPDKNDIRPKITKVNRVDST